MEALRWAPTEREMQQHGERGNVTEFAAVQSGSDPVQWDWPARDAHRPAWCAAVDGKGRAPSREQRLTDHDLTPYDHTADGE